MEIIVKKYKGAVFFDIDGTLINEDKGIVEPTENTKLAIKELTEKGYLVGIATGRAQNFLPKSIIDLNLEIYITCNGAIAKYRGENVVDDYIKEDICNEVIRYINEKNSEYIVVYDDACYYSGEENIRFSWITENIYPLSEYPPEYGYIRANKITASYTEKTVTEFKERFGDELYLMLHRHNMELGPIEVSKASGILKVAKIFDIDIDNIYTFGDDTNDIEMISEFKHGVAMTPHVKELENIADYITDSVESDGVYKALKHYGVI